jgi:hypothetical protein
VQAQTRIAHVMRGGERKFPLRLIKSVAGC